LTLYDLAGEAFHVRRRREKRGPSSAERIGPNALPLTKNAPRPAPRAKTVDTVRRDYDNR
jgi:hypothetical protein